MGGAARHSYHLATKRLNLALPKAAGRAISRPLRIPKAKTPACLQFALFMAMAQYYCAILIRRIIRLGHAVGQPQRVGQHVQSVY